MTEEQRMEEGRRMFQIFAARMFEQRVLTAYKEKVAKERQQKLLEELMDEEQTKEQKQAKKAKDAQKKREKLALKKQALAEEKSKREAEKAAEEAAIREAEARKAEEQRLKAEEKRKKREAEKKAAEEERLRKEAEKQRRLQEQRDKQAELERKQREAKEKERKEKEEQRRREREAKDAKDREAKERKEKQEKEKREKDARLKAEKEAKEKQRREDLASQQVAAQAALVASKRPPVPIPVSLQSQTTASPHINNVTPVIPKAPTPIKLRTTSSQQDSNPSVPQTPQSNGLSQNVSPVPSTPLQGSPGPIGPAGKNQNQNQHPFLHHPQATSPIHSALKGPPGMPPQPFGVMPPMGMGFQPGMPMMGPGYGARMQHDPMFSHQGMGVPFRPILGPNGMPLHQPGMGFQQLPHGRGFPLPHGPPGFPQQAPNGLGVLGQLFNSQKDGPSSQSHSRHQSASFEKPFENGNALAQPIARPAPIGRPSSIVHGQRSDDSGSLDVDDSSNHLGSRALLDDSDEPLTSVNGTRRSSAAPGNISRQGFPAPFGIEPSVFGSPIPGFNNWGAPPNPFGTSSLPGAGYMGGWGVPVNSSFGSLGGTTAVRSSQPRSVAVRLMICRACKNLEGSTPDGFNDINALKDQLEHLNPPGEVPVSEKELLDICETEGNAINGGGSFDIRRDANGHCSVQYQSDMPTLQRPLGAPGEIGSPIVGGGGLSRVTGPPPGF